ncbi:MAG: polymerase, sigma 28 subunit, FliA/WhiG [Firmicutes bacterium]|nr:polymerase, sigma 28 subunit, FliA/WhiG [Bacillota bacterium]
MMEKTECMELDPSVLWYQYRQTNNMDLKEKLIEYYLPLVRIVAGRIAIGLPHHVDKDDLINNGFFGLLNAIERFDIERGVKFETYAATRIRGSILDAIRAQDWIPTSLRQKARAFEETLGKLENQLGRSATDDEIGAALYLNPAELRALINQLNACTVISLDEFVQSTVLPHQTPGPLQLTEEQEVKTTLAHSISKLPEKERTVISLYYYEELTLKEISLILHLSEARISQLHTKALFRLRGSLAHMKTSLL